MLTLSPAVGKSLPLPAYKELVLSTIGGTDDVAMVTPMMD